MQKILKEPLHQLRWSPFPFRGGLEPVCLAAVIATDKVKYT